MYDLHERLKWDTLATRTKKSYVRIIYSCIHHKAPGYLYEKLTTVSHHGLRTRAVEAGALTVPRVKTELGKMGFSFRAPTIWNGTKVDIKAAVNINQLKRLIKTSWYG